MTAGGPERVTEIARTSRDPAVLQARLTDWLAGTLGPQSAPHITDVHGTDTNGMSSETVLFTATWHDGDRTNEEQLVARIAPDAADVPVFPSYDMRAQFDTIRLVHELTDVPVPRPRWCETDVAAIGAPFFVMDRVEGQVPPDVMPYPFGDNWLYDAPADSQRRLQDSTVAAIADLHAIPDAATRFAFLDRPEDGDTPLRRHVAHTRAWYDFVAAGGTPSSLIESLFDWLDQHWPADGGETVLCWGDSRIGNAMYADFTPVAILDWEMAGLGPRELDVGWLIYGHRIFQDMAVGYGLPGMPDFMRPDDVAGHYESLTGHSLRDLRWYMTYAAMQYGIVFLRTGQRAVHFGEREMPADVDELMYNRAQLDAMLTGTYWN